MEFIVGLIVIIVVLKIVGVSNAALIMGGLGFIELTIIAMLLFFVYFCLRLFTSRRRKCTFSRIDKPEGGKFSVAYYNIDGTEYPCVFPKETVAIGRTYSKDRECTVFFNKRLNKVFDIWALLTCLIGLAFSIFAVVFTYKVIVMLFVE